MDKEILNKEYFHDSEKLFAIISKFNFGLYDVTKTIETGYNYSWEELSIMGPSTKFIIGATYMFLPVPENGEDLKTAFQKRRDRLPALWVADEKDPRWISLELFFDAHLTLFNSLYFYSDMLIATTRLSKQSKFCDSLILTNSKVIETFEKYFHILSARERVYFKLASKLLETFDKPIVDSFGNITDKILQN